MCLLHIQCFAEHLHVLKNLLYFHTNLKVFVLMRVELLPWVSMPPHASLLIQVILLHPWNSLWSCDKHLRSSWGFHGDTSSFSEPLTENAVPLNISVKTCPLHFCTLVMPPVFGPFSILRQPMSIYMDIFSWLFSRLSLLQYRIKTKLYFQWLVWLPSQIWISIKSVKEEKKKKK